MTHFPDFSITLISFDVTLLSDCFRNDYSEVRLPNHPCLRIIANSEQTLTNYMSRRLLTYEKTDHPSRPEDVNSDNSIGNFRHNYFKVRIETRKERRTKEAQIREQNRVKHEQNGEACK